MLDGKEIANEKRVKTNGEEDAEAAALGPLTLVVVVVITSNTR